MIKVFRTLLYLQFSAFHSGKSKQEKPLASLQCLGKLDLFVCWVFFGRDYKSNTLSEIHSFLWFLKYFSVFYI